MKREELLKRFDVNIREEYKIRVIVDTDAKNEADDQYAIMHHLLTPLFKIEGIIATHYEKKDNSGESMLKSYKEINDLLALANIDDVKVAKGVNKQIDINNLEEAEGVDLIINEALKGKLYIACQGAMSNVATALLKAPEIAKNLVVLWNGGAPYNANRCEFNVFQDYKAVNVVLESEAEVWQIPQDVYSTLEVSLIELKKKVFPLGKLGEYLYRNIENESYKEYNPFFKLRTGENWVLGDNTTVGVLLINQLRDYYYYRPCLLVNEKGEYDTSKEGKIIKVYKSLDTRFVLEDLFAKLELVYK